jgi:hypothetical protein
MQLSARSIYGLMPIEAVMVWSHQAAVSRLLTVFVITARRSEHHCFSITTPATNQTDDRYNMETPNAAD